MDFKVITVSIAEHVLEQLYEYCERTGQKHTDVIRQAIYEFLNNMYIGNLPNIVECKYGDSDPDSDE